MVSLSDPFSKCMCILFWIYLIVGSLGQEPSLLSDFGLACFLGLYEEVKKARLRPFFFGANVDLLK